MTKSIIRNIFLLHAQTLKVYKLIHYQFIINIYFNRGQTFYSYKHQLVLDQPLYDNSNIVFNGKLIVSQNFAQSGIHKVRDIWDCEKNNFKDSNFIFNALIDKRNWISQWTRFKKAITGDLQNILNENENTVKI